MEIKKKIRDPNVKVKVSNPAEGTFITKGADNPTVRCDNW